MNIKTFPDSPYRLHQPFEPSGDQPTAIAQLVEGIEDGLAFQTLLGVTGSGKTYTMANVIARTGRPGIIMAATKAVLERQDAVIVATVSAIYGIGDPVDYHGMILHLRENEKIQRQDAIKRLPEMQYERNDVEFSRGHFRVRGDVIDIFPVR